MSQCAGHFWLNIKYTMFSLNNVDFPLSDYEYTLCMEKKLKFSHTKKKFNDLLEFNLNGDLMFYFFFKIKNDIKQQGKGI